VLIRRRLPVPAWAQFYRQSQVGGLWLRSQPWLQPTALPHGTGQSVPVPAEVKQPALLPVGGDLGPALTTPQGWGWQLGQGWGVRVAAGQQLHHFAGIRKAGFRARLYSQLPRGLRAYLLPIRTRQLLARFQRSLVADSALRPSWGIRQASREVRYANLASPLLRLAYKQP
jgi:hypothetical protein